MKKFLFALAALVFAGSASADVLLADFESIPAFNGTVVAATGDTADISTVPGTTGNAMQVIYDMKGNATYVGSGYRSWNMAAPVVDFGTNYMDLSKAQGFRFKVKSTGIDPMQFFFYVYDQNNKRARINTGNALKTTNGSWVDWKVPFATQKKDSTTYWADAPYGFGLQNSVWLDSAISIDLAHISKITFGMYDTAATTADANVTFALDDFYVYQDGPTYETILAEYDFNNYADEAAMKNDWKLVAAAANVNASITLGTAADGKKAMVVSDPAMAQWVNTGATFTLPAPVDMSTLAYAKIEMEGDSVYASTGGAGGLMNIQLNDGTGKICAALGYFVAGTPGRTVVYMALNTCGLVVSSGTGFASASWRAGTYSGNSDANKTFDFATVSKVSVVCGPQGTITTPGASYKIKKVTFGGTSAMPAAANVSDWSQF